MKWRVIFVLPLVLSAMGIRVPVDNEDVSEEADSDTKSSGNQEQSKPIYYEPEEPAVDSYLIPPNPHTPEEVLPDSVVTPATYLLPPTADKQISYYYAPTESVEQTDWYPIAQQPTPQNQQVQLLPPRPQNIAIPIFLSGEDQSKPFKVIQPPRTGKVLGDRFSIPIPSLKLEPPAEDAPNDYIIQTPSEELELPAEEIDQQYRPIQGNFKEVLPNTHLSPPKQYHRKNKKPTKLYPKKFNSSFKPVPIPISQFAEDSSAEVPRAKPAKYFKPLPGIEGLSPSDEKQIYLYEQAEQKRKVKDSEETQDQPENISSEQDVNEPPTEQDASETHYTYPGRYPGAPYPAAPLRVPSAPYPDAPLRGPPAPLRVAPAAPAPIRVAPTQAPQSQAPPAPDDRTEFRMHGMKGPHSYQFGYDTGKGKNRQFRYEERDNDGLVKGHYGYMDKHGKMRVVNYRAHPEHGFQADTQEENKE